ncbi:hypothetical protein WMF45_44350 [Sorangium sp. So ce448]|uniref:hypothetical protein n=1 Tax=Sorangium sp. So ce448 TaxID=3133314 RepID=UPI003F6385EA
MDTNVVTRELRQGTSLLTWRLPVHVTRLRSVLGVARLLGRMVVFTRMATGARALYVREDVSARQPGLWSSGNRDQGEVGEFA